MTADQELRKLALELAIQSRTISGGNAGVLTAAREFYDFLTNKETNS